MLVATRDIMRRILRKFFRSAAVMHMYAVRFCLGHTFVLLRFVVYARRVGASEVLRCLGAKVGRGGNVEPDVRIQNAAGGKCSNLEIGEHVYIGPGCLFDLASPIKIEDEVAVSARVCIITYADVGDRPLKQVYPRKEGLVTIKKGAWIGVNTTILHSVTVGEFSVIGAMSLVNRDIPPCSLAFGIPCSVVKHIERPLAQEKDSSEVY